MPILDLLKRSKAATGSAEIHAEIEAAETEHAAASAAIDTLRERRAVALLNPDDAPVAKIDAELEKQFRNLDRADALLNELRRRHGEAVQREAAEALAALRACGAAHRDAGIELLRRYIELAHEMAHVLPEYGLRLTGLQAVNQQLAAVASPPIEQPAAVLRTGQLANSAFDRNVVLPDPLNHPVRIWPMATDELRAAEADAAARIAA